MSRLSRAILCDQGNASLILGNAVFWAAAILVASKSSLDLGGNSMTVTGLLVAAWFACHSILQGRVKS